MKKIIKSLYPLLIIINALTADIAMPSPIKVIQPDGTIVMIQNRGNHLQGWHEFNGWTITQNNNGWWVFANGNIGRTLIPSNIKVGVDPDPVSIQKGIRPKPIVLEDNAPIPNLQMTRNDTFHVPLILVEFPDAQATYDSIDFEMIMNEEGYTHLHYNNTGSFRDFYQEISYGQFLPISEVTNWITAPEQHDHYAYSNPNGYDHVRELVRAMVDSLEEQGFDWSLFDNDGDGYVDALNLLHQGPGAEQGDYSNIWSHKWSLGNLAVQYDGVVINSYTMNPEIQSGQIVAIGVLAHEFGHALGLPDLYDTDYSSTGSGKLALMASGSWGTNGTTPWYPATMTGWAKNRLGWVDVIEILEDTDGIQIEQTFSSNQIIRVNHQQESEEYWLIENRQKIGSDTLMPEPGLCIWHINDNIANGWGVNSDEPYYGVGLEQADGLFNLENGGPSDGADVYPGITNNREFSNTSTPNTHSLYGSPSMLRIDNISDPGQLMTFDVEYNDIITAEASIINGAGYANNQGAISIALENQMLIEEFEFELVFSPAIVDIIGVSPTNRTTFDSVSINNNFITLFNPIIEPGSGPILNLNLFNNTGINIDVNVSFNLCSGYTSNNQEVGIIITDEATYEIQAINQILNIQGENGKIGGGASYIVSIENTIPVPLSLIQIIHDPTTILTPSNEPFNDLNNNSIYDDGEPFTDWNENGVWSPLIEPINIQSGWNINGSPNSSGVVVSFSNWDNPIEPGNHELFRINCKVEEEAELGDQIELNTNVLILLDIWSNTAVPFVNGNETIIIDGTLSTDFNSSKPLDFSLNKIYPNPFNPATTFSFSINKIDHVSINIYNLNGVLIKTLINQTLEPGIYEINWDANYFSSGIYFVEINSGINRDVRKITLLK